MDAKVYVERCLARPVFDPDRQRDRFQHWLVERRWSAGLSVNIGME